MVDKMRVTETLGKMQAYLQNHNSICVSVSGGSDSDIIVHIIAKHFRDYLYKIHFAFSNTGLEYKATKDHIKYLQEKYDITIETVRGMPMPLVVRKYGIPFVSKQVSEYSGRLQKHGFQWEDEPYESLSCKYDRCQSALKWWCNAWGEKSRFNIAWNPGLKDKMKKNPPDFQVSAMCCKKCKKEPLQKFQNSVDADLYITGERKCEGGRRARKQSCFESSHGMDHYMPLFFWNNETKQWYKEHEGIRYSDCYEVYGMERTGCTGCPFSLDREFEMKVMQKYEPNLYKACMNVFGKSYELMDKIQAHKKRRK